MVPVADRAGAESRHHDRRVSRTGNRRRYHRFRSSFRDWADGCTAAPREVYELALTHVNTDRGDAAYRRTDLFDRRRVLTNWAACVA